MRRLKRRYEREGGCGIQALTPQAKGRVDRLFQTLQGSLVKALRLAGISDMAAAKALLGDYLATHNARFAVAPADDTDAHLPYDGDAARLARLCAIHHRRKLCKDLALSFNGQRHIVQTHGAPRYALWGKKSRWRCMPTGVSNLWQARTALQGL